MLTTNSINRNTKQKVRRGEAMQIKTTVKAEIFSPGRLAKIKEINDASCWQRFRKLPLLGTAVGNINSSLTI